MNNIIENSAKVNLQDSNQAKHRADECLPHSCNTLELPEKMATLSGLTLHCGLSALPLPQIVNNPVAKADRLPPQAGAAFSVPGCLQSAPRYSPLVTKWAGFIDGLQSDGAFTWDWFGTWTFKNGNTHPEAAMKAMMRMIHVINREAYGVRYTKHKAKGIVWALATEYQGRGAIHYHGLFGAIPHRVRRMDFVDYWFKNNGIARIFKYENGRGAEQYLSKNSYAWKNGEIDLGGPLEYRLGNQVRFPFPVC